MKTVLPCCGALGLLAALLPATPEHGISAEIVPSQVRPGDLFELRVEMDRADYALYELKLPTHQRLHRVAVESLPVRFEGGRYRQGERWILQADSSGEVVMDGGMVLLESGSGPVAVELPPLRVEVMPYAERDESAEPVEFPAATPGASDWWRNVPVIPVIFFCMVLMVVLLLGVLLIVLLVARGLAKATGDKGRRAGVPLDEVLADIDSGQVASPALERMMVERGGGWSGELRAAVEAALYAGRGEPGQLAAILRKEVAR